MNKTSSLVPFMIGAFIGIFIAMIASAIAMTVISPPVMIKATKICESVGGLVKLEQDYGFVSGTCKDGSTVKLK